MTAIRMIRPVNVDPGTTCSTLMRSAWCSSGRAGSAIDFSLEFDVDAHDPSDANPAPGDDQ